MDRCWGPRNGQAGLTRVNPHPPPPTATGQSLTAEVGAGSSVTGFLPILHSPPPPPPRRCGQRPLEGASPQS